MILYDNLSDIIFLFVDLVKSEVSNSVDAEAPVIQLHRAIVLYIYDAVLVLEETFKTRHKQRLGGYPHVILGPLELEHDAVPGAEALGLTADGDLLTESDLMLNLKVNLIDQLLITFLLLPLRRRATDSENLLLKA